MNREEAIEKIKSIAADLNEKVENIQYECSELEDLVVSLECAAEMLEDGENGYIHLQVGEDMLRDLCRIYMSDLEDIDDLLEEAREVLYDEVD